MCCNHFNLLYFQDCLVKDNKNSLSIIHGKTYKKPSHDIVTQWILEILDRVDISTLIYKAHSARHASQLKLLHQGMNFESLLNKVV